MDDDLIQRRRWWTLGVLVIALLIVILDNTILNVALRTIQSDLEASQGQMQWAVDSYILVFAGLLVTFGVLGDRLGRRKVLLFGMIAFGVASAVTAFSQSSGQLIFFRAVMGIGAAAVQPQTLSIIQNVFKPHERGKAIGIWAGASGAAIALGPITGGLLLKFFWWGSVFLVNVPIVIIGVIGIWFLVPESKDPKPSKLDPIGVVLSIIGLVALVFGIIRGGNSNEWLTLQAGGAIVLGVVFMVAFVLFERRSSHPAIDMSLFTNRVFSAGTIALSCAFFALMGSTFYLAYFLQVIRGYTPLAAGVALIAVAIAVMIAAPVSARLVPRFGANRIAAFGLLLAGVALSCYAFFSADTPQWVVEVVMFTQGAGMGMTISPTTAAVMGTVARERAGAGSAVTNTARQVAGALGVAIIGCVLAVGFRSSLGSSRPADVARQLDASIAGSAGASLPDSARVGPSVRSDTSESIGGSLEFADAARRALEKRAQLAEDAGAQPDPQQRAEATAVLTGFVDDAKDSFLHAMKHASLTAGAVDIVGAACAYFFLADRRRRSDDVADDGDEPTPDPDESMPDAATARPDLTKSADVTV